MAAEAIKEVADAAGKAAASVGKTLGNAAMAGSQATGSVANLGANASRPAVPVTPNTGSGTGSNPSSLGNKPGGLNKNNGIGNSNRGLNRPHGIGNRNKGLGGNQGVGNKNKGLGDNKGLGNGLGKNEDGLHKKGVKDPRMNKANPFRPRNYFQRVKQIQNKKAERGEDATGILPYIQAIPFIVKVYVVSFLVFLTFIVFGVSIFAAVLNQTGVDYSVVSGALAGYTGQVANSTPQIGHSTSNTVINHVSEQYQSVAINLGYNQTLTTTDGTPVSEDEQIYYQKIADIAYRYKNLYNVELDWVLLTTANMYGHNSNNDFFKNNAGGYNSADLKDFDNTMSLDWDYDYEDIDGYVYLGKGDYTYDLQILAKNMVTKTTIQQCVSGTTVLEKKEVIDVEDDKLNEENPDYLVCKSGTYKVKSEYKLDTEKFDEFLLEYLESRMYGVKGKPATPSNSQYVPVTPSGQWGWPLPVGATSCRSSVYGTRKHPITGITHFHSGDDYPAAGGTPVYAIGDGTVVAVKTNCVVGDRNCADGAGNFVKIDHGGGVASVYMHASSVSVSVGQHVSRGQEIMKVGTTGSSTGNHLHITIRLNGELTDPANYIGALPHC